MVCCEGQSLSKVERTGILFSSIPLVCLGLLRLYGGGTQPPHFVDPLPGAISIGWRTRVAQLTLGTISIGAWLGALTFEYRVHIKSFLLALIPCVFVAWFSRFVFAIR